MAPLDNYYVESSSIMETPTDFEVSDTDESPLSESLDALYPPMFRVSWESFRIMDIRLQEVTPLFPDFLICPIRRASKLSETIFYAPCTLFHQEYPSFYILKDGTPIQLQTS